MQVYVNRMKKVKETINLLKNLQILAPAADSYKFISCGANL
jgi:hypothetical protein